MKKNYYLSPIDYKENTYIGILSYFIGIANTFEIVIRTDIDFNSDSTNEYDASALTFLEELTPFIYEKRFDTTWTASATTGSPAKIYTGVYNQDSLRIILKHTKKLSDWQGPQKPDDLSLLHNQSFLLSIIGRESLSFWNLDSKLD